jgi:hypothetical protein
MSNSQGQSNLPMQPGAASAAQQQYLWQAMANSNQQALNAVLQLGYGQGSAAQVNQFQGWPLPDAPSTEVLLHIGEYQLCFAWNGVYRLRKWKKVTQPASTQVGIHEGLVDWCYLPSRSSIAAAIREDRLRKLCVNARDPMDGSLLGVRIFKLSPSLKLQSPNQGTIWESNVLQIADEWQETEIVRGAAGIHAAWPPRSLMVAPLIDTVKPDAVSLFSCVRGYGRYVAGTEGWRAEKVIVDRVFLPESIRSRWRMMKRLEKLYPEISFEEQPWTLERSLKLARSSRTKSHK